ncbi:hypothetical protein [Paraburkholderia antibiotica]|uniref:Uncharacterized protein n=1 Tax=Paraburkholderia antibiotica TaxID=2728839 RepID=A0A7Y0FGW1_9BURK|nr:hypothetical protein [Paraburkholderia antibiotica]NML35478.1 hypothetical protein [Paraburkholderia antibiotica]
MTMKERGSAKHSANSKPSCGYLKAAFIVFSLLLAVLHIYPARRLIITATKLSAELIRTELPF